MPEQLRYHSFADLWHPEVLAWVVLLQVAYLLAVGPWREAFRWGPPATRRQKLCFSLAVWTVYLSEGTPVHILSEQYLFSVHMLQHILITMVLPPLLVLGLPPWVMRAALRPRLVAAAFRVVSRPVPALLLFNLVYSFWHLPAAYEAVLYYHWFHMVQHAVLVLTAALTWWPVFSPLPEYPRISEPAQLIYIFLSGVCQIAVFGVITFADSVLYDFYARAPRVWPALTPQADQQLAGIVMKLGGMAVFVLVWAVVFFRWAAREEAGSEVRRVEQQV